MSYNRSSNTEDVIIPVYNLYIYHIIIIMCRSCGLHARYPMTVVQVFASYRWHVFSRCFITLYTLKYIIYNIIARPLCSVAECCYNDRHHSFSYCDRRRKPELRVVFRPAAAGIFGSLSSWFFEWKLAKIVIILFTVMFILLLWCEQFLYIYNIYYLFV